MSRRQRDLERDVQRVVDPFQSAARLWGEGQAERRRAGPIPTAAERRSARRRERAVILAVGRHTVTDRDDGRPVTPGRSLGYPGAPTPEYYIDLRGAIEGAPEPPIPPPPPPPEPPHERSLEALRARAEASRARERLQRVGPYVPPLPDAASRAREQERQRRLREAYEAGRPRGSRSPAESGALASSPQDESGAPYRPLTAAGRAAIERDVEGVVSSGGVTPRSAEVRERDLARMRALVRGPVTLDRGTAGPSPGRAEIREEVLRALNRKYGVDVVEPWRMLAYLRQVTEQMAGAGRRGSDRFRMLVSDYDRLRRAAESLDI